MNGKLIESLFFKSLIDEEGKFVYYYYHCCYWCSVCYICMKQQERGREKEDELMTRVNGIVALTLALALAFTHFGWVVDIAEAVLLNYSLFNSHFLRILCIGMKTMYYIIIIILSTRLFVLFLCLALMTS